MRIHSDKLTRGDIQRAAREANVWITDYSEHGSRKRYHAFEVKLSGSSPYRQNGGKFKAATWDEWGIFLNALFDVDPAAICGDWHGYDRFAVGTGWRFDDLTPAEQHVRHDWQYVQGCHRCACGATQRMSYWGDPAKTGR